jgi:hypothetical protein
MIMRVYDDFKPGLKGWIKTIIIEDDPESELKVHLDWTELGQYGGYDFERPVYGNVIKKDGNVIYARFMERE